MNVVTSYQLLVKFKKYVLLLVSATTNKIPSHGGFHPLFCMLFLYTTAQVTYLQYEVDIILNLRSESYITTLRSFLRWLVLFFNFDFGSMMMILNCRHNMWYILYIIIPTSSRHFLTDMHNFP